MVKRKGGNLVRFLVSEKGQGVLRHLLGALGGTLVGMGVFDADVLEQATGSLMTLYAVILSIKSKK